MIAIISGISGIFGAINSVFNIKNWLRSRQKEEDPKESFIVVDLINLKKEDLINDMLASLDSEKTDDCKKGLAKINHQSFPDIDKLDIFGKVGRQIMMNPDLDLISFLVGEFGLCLTGLCFQGEKDFQDYIMDKATLIVEDWWEENIEYQKGKGTLLILELIECLPFISKLYYRIFQDVADGTISSTPEIEERIQKIKMWV